MIKNCKKFITPISIKGWTLPSDINGLLDFSLNVYHLLVKDFDPLSFNLMVASGLVTFPDYRFCLFLVFWFPAFWAINWGQKSVVLFFIQENVAFIQLSIYQPHNQFVQPMNNMMKSKFELLPINNFWGTLRDKWSSCGGPLTRKAQTHGGGHRVNFDRNLPSSCFVVQYNSLISMI